MVSVDIVSGLRQGFLANIDYRLFVDNIKWEAINSLGKGKLSPKNINRTLFITEWDEAVVLELKRCWESQANPRAIVFCGTIDHAITMRDRINSYGFCNAGAMYSGTIAGRTMQAYERNRMLSDFHDGHIGTICVVDIFNEGVDVPDVNIIVFQRVTHSRRIFVQQLGRGLRLAPNKQKVTVLDFVSDIRRFAAGIHLKDDLNVASGVTESVRIKLNNSVTFHQAGKEDPNSESFLRQWIDDVAAVEDADDDSAVLRFPPLLPGGKT
jgi:superfamily II DNA or RNA helicase